MPWGSAYSVGWKMDFYRLEGTPSLRKKAGECYGPGLYELLRSAQPTTANGGFLFSCALLNDHCLAGVSRFYGGVYHARVVAQSAYSPVHGVAVFHHEKVVTAATLGHVAVVGVGSGVEVVMAGLGDHPVCHPVADPLEEHLVVSGGHAGLGLTLDHPSDHLSQGRAAPHQRHEHHHDYHQCYLRAHLFLLPSGEGDRFSACSPLSVLPSRCYRLGVTVSVLPSRTLIAAPGARRIPNYAVPFLPYSPECVEKEFCEVRITRVLGSSSNQSSANFAFWG